LSANKNWVRKVFRPDADFAKPEIYEALEGRGVKYAIRIPANDSSLQRDIAELLTRPVGRPSHKPVVWYKGFLYQAASWNTARRVVAEVEFHFGELSPSRIHRDQLGNTQPKRGALLAEKNRLLVHHNSMQEMTVERFASMFQVTGGEWEDSLTMANALEECMQMQVVNGDPTRPGPLSRNENAGRAENNNRTTFRALFKKIAGVERSYGNNG